MQNYKQQKSIIGNEAVGGPRGHKSHPRLAATPYTNVYMEGNTKLISCSLDFPTHFVKFKNININILPTYIVLPYINNHIRRKN